MPRSLTVLAIAAQALLGCSSSQDSDDVFEPVSLRAAALMGTWTRVSAPFPDGTGPGNLTLLSDGRVLASGPETSNKWYTLTPDASGSYANGTWTQIESSNQGRLFNPSFTLRDARYLNCGGEYVVDAYELRQHASGTDRARCEIFDPVSESWSNAPDMPETVADAPAAELDDGRILLLSHASSNSYLLDSFHVAPSWASVAPYDSSAIDSEGGCVPLPDKSIFCGNKQFRRYIPSTSQGSWVATAATPGLAVGEFLPTPTNGEIGAFLLLHTGKVLVLGGNQRNGLYTPPSGSTPDSWTLTADTPTPFNHADAPATVEPDNKVFTATTDDASGLGAGAVVFFEYDPAAPNGGTWTRVPLPNGTVTFPSAERTRFLNLPKTDKPTGQILVTGSNDGSVWLYQPAGTPLSAWRPSLSNISNPSAGVYTLTGTQLNGLTTGAEFGDDGKMATNFPVVTLTMRNSPFNSLWFARTYDYGQMAPANGTSGSCKFTLPTSLPNGDYDVRVSANGVGSLFGLPLAVRANHVAALSGPTQGADVGSSVTWQVTLALSALNGPMVVNLSSSETNVATVPASVTIPQGQAVATFPLTTRGFGRSTISAITSAPNNQFKPATRKFGWTIESLEAVGIPYRETSATWTLALSEPAPPSGIEVSLSSSNTAVASVPATIAVPGGARSVPFVVTNNFHEDQTTTITASLLNSSMSRVEATGLLQRIGGDADDHHGMDFRKCANEGETCFVNASSSGGGYVAFGAFGTFTFRPVLGYVPCDVALFGDPLVGTVKACYFAPYGFVAAENSQITVPGGNTVNVAYGANAAFVYKQMSNTFACTNSTFGDPAVGVVKGCYFGPSGYSFVANEGGTMSLSYQTPVAYGNNGSFVFRVMSGAVDCNNATFGDPLPGIAKACYALNDSYLADESQPYAGQGQNYVLYGSGLNGAFVTSNANSGTCSNAFFGGDPDVGHLKHCWE